MVSSDDTIQPLHPETMNPEMRRQLAANFTKSVKGYHLINNDPIKETPWEDINAAILVASGCPVADQSHGSHRPGADITCALGGLSNKSTQYDAGGKSFKISSYRLTTVCSDKEPGDLAAIVAEINRRKNFDYYSIVARRDSGGEGGGEGAGAEATHLQYDWYMIPSDYPAVNPATYTWTPKLGKTGKNKGTVVGWETNVIQGSSMSISFSMSSQLWMSVHLTDEMAEFVVGSCRILPKRRLNYMQLYDLIMASEPTVPTEPKATDP